MLDRLYAFCQLGHNKLSRGLGLGPVLKRANVYTQKTIKLLSRANVFSVGKLSHVAIQEDNLKSRQGWVKESKSMQDHIAVFKNQVKTLQNAGGDSPSATSLAGAASQYPNLGKYAGHHRDATDYYARRGEGFAWCCWRLPAQAVTLLDSLFLRGSGDAADHLSL